MSQKSLSNDRSNGRFFRPMLFVVVALTLLCVVPAWGQQNEASKLIASDGAESDDFGHSVSLDGDVALVGARHHEHSGIESGSAYVFRFDAVNGTWIEEAELTASDGAADDCFGGHVVLSGECALIGASGDDNYTGSAYVFRYDAGSATWSEEAKLTASDGVEYDFFGAWLSLDGDVALIGAEGDDDNGDSSGSAYVFRYDAGSATWFEEAKLTASDGAERDRFGDTLYVEDGLAMIGAWGDDDNGSDSGSVYVFRFDAGSATWFEEAKLTASDGSSSAYFGDPISVSGDVALFGAFGDDSNISDAGSAYVFRYDAGSATWIEEAKLTASDAVEEAFFGESVSLEDDVALIGAFQDDDNGDRSGSAYVFRYDASTGTWVEGDKRIASDGAERDHFGDSVSLSGDVALIGAADEDDNGSDSGAAYLFEFTRPISLDVKINGEDGNLCVNATDNLICTIDIVDNDQAFEHADVWVLGIYNNVGFCSYGDLGSASWSWGWNNVYFTGGLFDHSATVFDGSLPNGVGIWSIYLAADDNPNGVLDYSNIMGYDSVSFVVVP